MEILDIDVCDLAVYSKLDDHVLVVHVPRDRAYGRSLVCKLHDVYFKHILPYLSAKRVFWLRCQRMIRRIACVN